MAIVIVTCVGRQRTIKFIVALLMVMTAATTSRAAVAPIKLAGGSGDVGCGVRGDTQERIVGGQVASSWPWMAALYRSTSSQYCAGVLISDRHVLTAAHCVAGTQPSKLTVKLGLLTIKGRPVLPTAPDDTAEDSSDQLQSSKASGQQFGVEKVVIHESYEAVSHLNDIAILRLDSTVNYDLFPSLGASAAGSVRRICLPPTTLTSLQDTTAVVAGWGTTSFMGAAPHRMREVTVSIWSNDACLKAIGRNVFETTLCAGGRNKSADACQGDSGGPLMQQMADGRWAVVGVVSWGIKCGEINKPGLYTRTSRYTDWILSVVRRT